LVIAILHPIRFAAVLAGITLAFVLSASLDQIKDDPGIFNQRGLEATQSVQAEPQVDPATGAALLWRGTDSSPALVWSAFRLAFENNAAFEALFGVRIAADSSPPIHCS
jgi:hypothetical protein